MKRRTLLQALAVAAVFPLIPACFRAQVVGEAAHPITPLNKTRKEWRELLSARAYQILFEEATERPESSNLVYEVRALIYVLPVIYHCSKAGINTKVGQAGQVLLSLLLGTWRQRPTSR